MNEFSKGAPISLPGALPLKYSQTFEIIIKVRNEDGAIVGIVGPQNMPAPVTIDILATAIKAMALPMITGEDQTEPSRIIVPKLAGVKPLS